MGKQDFTLNFSLLLFFTVLTCHTLHFFLKPPHLTALHSLNLSLSGPVPTKTICYLFVSPAVSFSTSLPLLCLITDHSNRKALVELTPKQQNWIFGFCPLGFLSVSFYLVFCPFLFFFAPPSKISFEKKSFYILSSRSRDRKSVLNAPLTAHIHLHYCLSFLPNTCFTFQQSSLHQTQLSFL